MVLVRMAARLHYLPQHAQVTKLQTGHWQTAQQQPQVHLFRVIIQNLACTVAHQPR